MTQETVILKKLVRTKLKVNKLVDESLFKACGIYRKCFNTSMNTMFEYYNYSTFKEPSCLSADKIYKLLVSSAKNTAPFIFDVECGIIQGAVKHAHKIYTKQYVGKVVPHLSRKKDGSFFKSTSSLKVQDDSIYIPKIGNIRIAEKGYIPNGSYRDVKIERDGVEWYILLKVDKKVLLNFINRNPEEILIINFKKDGTLIVNNKEWTHVIDSMNYQKKLTRLKRLQKEYRRKYKANMELCAESDSPFKKSSNMKKVQVKIEKLVSNLEHMRLEYFRKVASELSKSTAGSAKFPSNEIIRKEHEDFLSKVHRQAGTRSFFNILKSKLEHSGLTVSRWSKLDNESLMFGGLS